MPDTTATPGDSSEVTFINIFHTLDREDQEKIVQSLIQVTQEVMRHQPGFISARLHRSLDGTSVTNLARWRSAKDLKTALALPRMLAHREELGEKYVREGYLGQEVYTYVAQAEERVVEK